MKQLRASRDPVNLRMSLRRAGGLIASIAQILSGFASILRCDTRKPRSFPAKTPKTHFLGLSFMEVARSLSKYRVGLQIMALNGRFTSATSNYTFSTRKFFSILNMTGREMVPTG
jgi:hypothetical protein